MGEWGVMWSMGSKVMAKSICELVEEEDVINNTFLFATCGLSIVKEMPETTDNENRETQM